VTVAAAYRVQPNVEVFGRVENALDEDYEEISGFNTPGVAAYAGLRVTLEDPSTASWAQYK
jgi:vitamin B12 transporter